MKVILLLEYNLYYCSTALCFSPPLTEISLCMIISVGLPFKRISNHKMSLTCFFGTVVEPNTSVTPPRPPKSSLVISNICVAATAVTGGSISIYAQVPNLPQRLCLGTLYPDAGIYHLACNHLFNQGVTFVTQSNLFGKGGNPPAVHLTGYFEAESDDQDSIATSDSDREEEEFVPTKKSDKKKEGKNNKK